jgi:hypothetical protein
MDTNCIDEHSKARIIDKNSSIMDRNLQNAVAKMNTLTYTMSVD